MRTGRGLDTFAFIAMPLTTVYSTGFCARGLMGRTLDKWCRILMVCILLRIGAKGSSQPLCRIALLTRLPARCEGAQKRIEGRACMWVRITGPKTDGSGTQF